MDSGEPARTVMNCNPELQPVSTLSGAGSPAGSSGCRWVMRRTTPASPVPVGLLRDCPARFEFLLLPAARGVLDDPGDLPAGDLVLDPDHRVHRHLPQP